MQRPSENRPSKSRDQEQGLAPGTDQAVFQKQRALFFNQTHKQKNLPQESLHSSTSPVHCTLLSVIASGSTASRPWPWCLFKTFQDNRIVVDSPGVEVWRTCFLVGSSWRRIYSGLCSCCLFPSVPSCIKPCTERRQNLDFSENREMLFCFFYSLLDKRGQTLPHSVFKVWVNSVLSICNEEKTNSAISVVAECCQN